MKKSLLFCLALFLIVSTSRATVHEILVWNGYFQFLPSEGLVVELGDTIQWLPLDQPSMAHTVTSTDIPEGAMTFDYIWQAPADTFFQYVPTVIGTYDYVCTPHEIQFNMVGRFTVVDGTTDVTEIDMENGFMSLFPNPAADLLSIDLSGLEANEWTVHLMDYTGRQLDVLFQGVIRSGNRTVLKSVAHLPSGIYYVLLESDGYRRAQRWVKR